jgi:ABC-type phosphate/phosphonate transport system permease subunit
VLGPGSLAGAVRSIGLVGAGGVGFALNGAILGLEWSRVGMILVVVAASETASAYVRKRLT